MVVQIAVGFADLAGIADLRGQDGGNQVLGGGLARGAGDGDDTQLAGNLGRIAMSARQLTQGSHGVADFDDGQSGLRRQAVTVSTLHQ